MIIFIYVFKLIFNIYKETNQSLANNTPHRQKKTKLIQKKSLPTSQEEEEEGETKYVLQLPKETTSPARRCVAPFTEYKHNKKEMTTTNKTRVLTSKIKQDNSNKSTLTPLTP